MKRILSLSLALLMLITTISALGIPASAEQPDLAPQGQIWEGETDLRATNYVSSNNGAFYPQNVSGYNSESDWPDSARPSMNGQAIWKSGAVGDYLEIPLDVEVQGEKTLILQYMHSQDFGIFDIYWDGELIYDDLDTYASKTDRKFVELDLGTRNVTRGTHSLKFVVASKNAESAGYALGVDYFELVGENGVRNYVNIENGGDDYAVVTKLDGGAVRYEVEALEKVSATKAMINDGENGEPKYAIDSQGVGSGWQLSYPLSFTRHLHWVDAKEGEEISFIFKVETSGEYALKFHSLTAANYGIVEIQIDSAPVVMIDQYSSKLSSVVFEAEDTMMLKAGYHTLTMVQKGKSDVSTGYHQSLDFLEISMTDSYYVTTGQIWEGENELRDIHYNTVGLDMDFYGQDVASYNTNANSPVKPSKDGHAIWKNVSLGDTLELELDVKTTGLKTFYFQYMCSQDFGIFDIYWDGELIGNDIDMYAASSNRHFVEFNLGERMVEAGLHTLEFVSVGKNASATKYNMSVDFLELVGTDGARRTQKIDKRGSDYGKVYYYDTGAIRYEAEKLPLSEGSQAIFKYGTNYDTQLYISKTATTSSLNHVRWYYPKSDVKAIGFTFNVDKTDYYYVSIGNVTAPEFGIVQYQIDGVNIGGEVDQYAGPINGEKNVSSVRTEFSERVKLTAGEHTLTMVYAGANASSSNKVASIDYIEIIDISTAEGSMYHINPDVTPPTGDATWYVVAALSVSTIALVTLAIVKFKKERKIKQK
ncbi:MAG: hypothetical protein IJY27_00510 [Clostridia bacterium]|nr:hypothetical protein [Clostridia bacterium]